MRTVLRKAVSYTQICVVFTKIWKLFFLEATGGRKQKPAEERRNHSEGRRNPSRGAAEAGFLRARAAVSTSEAGFCRSRTETPSQESAGAARERPAGGAGGNGGNGGNEKPE